MTQGLDVDVVLKYNVEKKRARHEHTTRMAATVTTNVLENNNDLA